MRPNMFHPALPGTSRAALILISVWAYLGARLLEKYPLHMRSLLAVNSALSLSDGGDLSCLLHVDVTDLGLCVFKVEVHRRRRHFPERLFSGTREFFLSKSVPPTIVGAPPFCTRERPFRETPSTMKVTLMGQKQKEDKTRVS